MKKLALAIGLGAYIAFSASASSLAALRADTAAGIAANRDSRLAWSVTGTIERPAAHQLERERCNRGPHRARAPCDLLGMVWDRERVRGTERGADRDLHAGAALGRKRDRTGRCLLLPPRRDPDLRQRPSRGSVPGLFIRWLRGRYRGADLLGAEVADRTEPDSHLVALSRQPRDRSLRLGLRNDRGRRRRCGGRKRARVAAPGWPHVHRDHRDRDHAAGRVRYPVRRRERPLGPPLLAARGFARNGWRRWRRCLGRWRYVAPRERGARRSELTRGTEGWTLRLGRRWAASHRARLRRHEPTDVVGGVRQHRHQASPLEGGRQHALMLGAGAALAAGIDLAAIADIAADATDIFVVDLLHFIDAERTDLAARTAETRRSAVPAAGSTGTAGWSVAPRAP